MKYLPLALAIITMTGLGTATADPVDPANVTTFQSGTPALAGEVNSTMQALITAIDDNASRIAAMETTQASLVPGDLTNNIYCFVGLDSAIGAGDPDPVSGNGAYALAGTGKSIGQLTFTSSTQATFAESSNEFADLILPNNTLSVFSDPPENETFTWTLSNNRLSLTVPGEPAIEMFVTPDANVLIAVFTETDRTSDDSGDIFDATLMVGVRASSCN